MDEELDYRTIFPQDGRNLYTNVLVGRIEDHRSELEGELFFDLILSDFAKVKNVATVYPPRTTKALVSLHQLIVTSPHLDSLKKHTLLYYLLLDLPSPHAASKFAVRFHLPANFITLITGLHHLDHLELSEALPHLTSPSIVPPSPEKILATLFRHGTPDQVVSFVACVQPVLASPASIELYFEAQLALSPEGAFLYSRTSAPGVLRKKFMKRLVEFCLTSDPAENALRLLNLPYDDEEKTIFVETLERSPLEVARDTLVVWQMHQGRVEEALKGTRKTEGMREVGKVDWDTLGEGLQKGLGGRGVEA